MQFTQHARKLVLFSLTLAMMLTASFSEAKPPPPTSGGPTPPAHTGSKPKPKPIDTTPKGPDRARFAQAYERADEPSMLVLVGRDTRTFEKLGTTATGSRSANSTKVIGGELNLIDVEGNAQKLHADIESILLENPDVDLLDLSALTEVDRREAALLKMDGDNKAVDLLATKLNAEIVLLVRLIDTPAVRAKGARYRVILETIDVPRGRKIGSYSFDWMQGTDSRTVRAYATAITRKFMDQFINVKLRGGADGAPRKYTVKFIGLDDAMKLRAARDAFKLADGVSKARTRGMSKAGGTSVGELQVTFAGDPLDLVFDVNTAMSKSLGMVADASDIQAGTITFKVGKLQAVAAPPFKIVVQGVSKADEAVAIREKLKLIPGISEVTDQGMVTPPGGVPQAVWTSRYFGQPLDLAQQASGAVSEVTGGSVNSEVTFDPAARMSVVTLMVTGPAPRWLMLMSPELAEGRKLRAEFKQAYNAQNAPKVGLMVNRVLVDVGSKADPTIEQEVIRLLREDPDNPNLKALIAKLNGGNAEVSGTGLAQGGGEGGAGEGVVVSLNLVSGDVNNNATTPNNTTTVVNGSAFNLELNNAQVENAIYKRFIKLGVTMLDPGTVRTLIADQAAKTKSVMKEDELVRLLGDKGGMDIAILGHGRLIEGKRGAAGQTPPSIVYTFRAIRLKDGVTLAADSFARDLSFTKGQDEADQFIAEVARYFAGNLADQVWSQW